MPRVSAATEGGQAPDALERRLSVFERQLGGELHASLEARLDAVSGRVEAETKRSLETIEAARSRVQDQIDAIAEKLSTSARRQELKMVRREQTRKIESARKRLEQRGEALYGEIEARVRAFSERHLGAVKSELDGHGAAISSKLVTSIDDARERGAEAERRIAAAGARIEGSAARIDGALARIEASEARVIASEDRAAAAEEGARRSAVNAQAAADWESRLTAAVAVEDEVARRIEDAERRLLGLVDGGERA
jgi:hypothetical protein